MTDEPTKTKPVMRQVFGVTRHYPGPCLEIRFPAPSGPVPVARLESELRKRVARWGEALPPELPAEEAVARLAHGFVTSRIPTWFRFRREGDTAIAALGTAPAPAFIGSVLSAVERALLGPDDAQRRALAALDELANALRKELAINWTVMDVARDLGLDSVWIAPDLQLFQIGMGARGRQFRQLATDRDSATGIAVSQTKHHTIAILRKLGLPATRSMMVFGSAEASAAMKRIGFPCVVKPLSMGRGIGITTGITRQADLEAAIERAIKFSSPPVVVENHVAGIDHRIMVAAGKVLWAYSKVPATVVGDGTSRIEELIERENRSRNSAKTGGATLREPIKVNGELTGFLARRYGLRLADVLPSGQTIELAGQSNIAMGGTLTDVTTDLHHDNRLMAERVARYLRMDSLGIDFITPDISRSWKDVDCAIIEVNSMPGISGRGDAALTIRTHFPRLRSGKIPVLTTVGSEGFRTQALNYLRSAVTRAGLRATVLQCVAAKGNATLIPSIHPQAVETALIDPDIEALVVSCDAEWIEARGFPFAHADILLAEEPASLAFLKGVVDEIVPLPPDASALARRVAEIAAGYADGGPVRPLVTVQPDLSSGSFRFRCLRFRALPREWVYRKLSLRTDNGHGMIGFGDVFEVIGQLTNAALAERGEPPLQAPIAFDMPGPGWTTPSVEGTLTVRPEAMAVVEPALARALDKINDLFATEPD